QAHRTAVRTQRVCIAPASRTVAWLRGKAGWDDRISGAAIAEGVDRAVTVGAGNEHLDTAAPGIERLRHARVRRRARQLLEPLGDQQPVNPVGLRRRAGRGSEWMLEPEEHGARSVERAQADIVREVTEGTAEIEIRDAGAAVRAHPRDL